MQGMIPFAARILIAAIFVWSGAMKLAHPEHVVSFMAAYKIPMAGILVYWAGAAEMVGGLMVITGMRARLGALILLLFLIPTTLIFHTSLIIPFADAAQARMQMTNLMKNLSLVGGLLYIIAFGSGTWSASSSCPLTKEKK